MGGAMAAMGGTNTTKTMGIYMGDDMGILWDVYDLWIFMEMIQGLFWDLYED
jgi:hypothetical protein